tara:strand:+ start:170 stop:889 length:720 start_codon:yes stop_codon:yes gene_type:complete
MSQLQVDDIINRSQGAAGFSQGTVITGVCTATTGSFTTGSFTGNVSIGGTLTYEDVTNIDSVGIITARTGVKVTAGGVDVTAGGINVTGGGSNVTGVGTFATGVNLEDLLKEETKITAGKLSDNLLIELESGMVHYFTTAESTTATPNIRYNGSTTLTSKMAVGDTISVTLITTANAAAYCANIQIDDGAVTENWIGGSAPTDGGSSGVDIHSFTIIKIGTSGTPNNDFTVIANQSKTS